MVDVAQSKKYLVVDLSVTPKSNNVHSHSLARSIVVHSSTSTRYTIIGNQVKDNWKKRSMNMRPQKHMCFYNNNERKLPA